MAIDPNNLSAATLTFNDDFNSFDTSTWGTAYPWGGTTGNTNTGNNEEQWYLNAGYAARQGIDTYDAHDGVLDINAAPTPSSLMGDTQDHPYTSGLINTADSFSQTYGYFEMRASLPAGQGVWPAFWLLPSEGGWPPELDVVETIGSDPDTANMTVHSGSNDRQSATEAHIPGLTGDGQFHTYGADWEPDTITWYIDGNEVFQTETPSDMHQPMYMLANLAIGGNWPGSPDGSTDFPSTMSIDYIRAYSDAPNAQGVPAGDTTPAADGAAGTGNGSTAPSAGAGTAPGAHGIGSADASGTSGTGQDSGSETAGSTSHHGQGASGAGAVADGSGTATDPGTAESGSTSGHHWHHAGGSGEATGTDPDTATTGGTQTDPTAASSGHHRHGHTADTTETAGSGHASGGSASAGSTGTDADGTIGTATGTATDTSGWAHHGHGQAVHGDAGPAAPVDTAAADGSTAQPTVTDPATGTGAHGAADGTASADPTATDASGAHQAGATDGGAATGPVADADTALGDPRGSFDFSNLTGASPDDHGGAGRQHAGGDAGSHGWEDPFQSGHAHGGGAGGSHDAHGLDASDGHLDLSGLLGHLAHGTHALHA